MKFADTVKAKYTLETGINPIAFEENLREIGYVVKNSMITAMAHSRKDAMSKLEALHLQISEHLMKVVAIPTSTCAPHWKVELKAWQKTLRLYNKAKSRSGENFSHKDLTKWLWECPLGTKVDRDLLLKILREEGYGVPATLSKTNTVQLKKLVEEFVQGVLGK